MGVIPIGIWLAASTGWAGEPIRITSVTNPNIQLQINAYGGSYHGTTLKAVANCPAESTDCTWTLLPNGMIVSDTNPSLAWNAYGGATHGAEITLVNNCQPSLTDCTWTVRDDGLIVSNTNPQLAVNAYGGVNDLAPLKLVSNCAPELDGCKWLGSSAAGWPSPGTNSMLYSAGTNNVFGVNAHGGAKQGTELQVVKDCPVGHPDCMWRFRSDGMVISSSSAALAWNAYGGALVGTKITLVVGCPSNNTDCQWDQRPDGLIVSRTNPKLAVKAQGGPHDIAPLVLVDDCTPAIAGCTWTAVPQVGIYGPYSEGRDQFHNFHKEVAVGGNRLDLTKNQLSIILKRPFNIVAVGDSLMWGQGLSDNNKFVRLVAKWLNKQLGKEDLILHLEGLAHSGAITYPMVENGPDGHSSLSGEVPRYYPSIYYQITQLVSAKVHPGEVDLVLVDGCVNNVNVRNIILPVQDTEQLKRNTREYCGGHMARILAEVGQTFPHAKVIVVGYPLLISGKSNLTALMEWWAMLRAPIPAPGAQAFHRDLAAGVSEVFLKESESALRSAVSQANALPPPVGGNRFRYAAPLFQAENAYGADSSWLWLAPGPLPVVSEIPKFLVKNPDEVFFTREGICRDTYGGLNLTQLHNLVPCQGASMGHPNVEGARQYAAAITATVGEFIPEWRMLFGLRAPAPERVINRNNDGPSEVCPVGWKCSPK